MSILRLAVASCLTGVAVLAAPDPSKVTFNKDVLPILEKNCQSCHRPGEVAPMSLLTYSDARPWAKAIKAAVATQKMPPWFADPRVRAFRERAQAERARHRHADVVGRQRSAEGDAKDKPAPLHFPGRLEYQARHRRRNAQAVPGAGHRHHQLQVHSREDEFPAGHVDHGRGDASRQFQGAAPRQGVGAAARIALDGKRRARRSLRERKRSGASSDATAPKRATTFWASSIPDWARRASMWMARPSSCPRDRTWCSSCITPPRARPTEDVSKVGLVLAKNAPQTRYFLRRTHGVEPRDSARRRATPRWSAR